MIIESILGIVTGLGGSIATGIMNHKAQKLKNEHELAMINAETNAMIAEAEANIKITEQQIQGNIAIAENDNFLVSQQFGNQVNVSNQLIEKLFDRKWTTIFGVLLTFLLGIVDVLRTAMRPGITIILMLILTVITSKSATILMSDSTIITNEQLFELVASIIYLTFSVVGWWFGDRSLQKFNRIK